MKITREDLEQEDESKLPLDLVIFYNTFHWHEPLVNDVVAAKCPDHSYSVRK